MRKSGRDSAKRVFMGASLGTIIGVLIGAFAGPLAVVMLFGPMPPMTPSGSSFSIPLIGPILALFELAIGLGMFILWIGAVIVGAGVGGIVGSLCGSLAAAKAIDAGVADSQPLPAETVDSPTAELKRLRARIAELENSAAPTVDATNPVGKPEILVNANAVDAIPSTIDQPTVAETDPNPPVPAVPPVILWVGRCPSCETNVDMIVPRVSGQPAKCPNCNCNVVMDYVTSNVRRH